MLKKSHYPFVYPFLQLKKFMQGFKLSYDKEKNNERTKRDQNRTEPD